MTLAQLNALMNVENRTQTGSDGKLAPPAQRNWGTASDLALLGRRTNGGQ